MNQQNNINQNLDPNNLNNYQQPIQPTDNSFVVPNQNMVSQNIPMQPMNWQQPQYVQPQYIPVPVQQMPMQQPMMVVQTIPQMMPVQQNSQIQQKNNGKDVKLFKNERNWTVIKLIILSIVLAATLAVTGVFVYCTVLPEKNFIPNFSPYYLIPLGLFDLITFAFWIMSIIKVKNWNHTISTICNSQSEKVNSNLFIKSFFRNSIKWNVSINWFCGYIYFLWLFMILFAFTSSYFTSVWYLGGNNAPSFGTIDWTEKLLNVEGGYTNAAKVFAKLPFYTLVFGSAIVGAAIIVQTFNIVIFNIRRKALYTNFESVFSDEEYGRIFRFANKVNFIIYCTLTVIFIIVLILFFVLSKKLFKK